MSIATATASSRALVATQSTALTTTDALPNVIKTVRDSDKELAVITKGKAGFAGKQSLLAKYAKGADKAVDVVLSPWIIPGLAVVSGVPALVGAFAAGGHVALIAAGCGAGAAVASMVAGIPAHYLAKWKGNLAKKNLVAEEQLRPMIERFDAATGAQKAAYGVILEAWSTSMREQKSLSPEARYALDRVCKEVSALPREARTSATALREIATLVTVKKWTVDEVHSLEQQLRVLPADQQLAIALDVYELRAKADNDYDATHALFDLKVKYTPVPVQPVDVQL